MPNPYRNNAKPAKSYDPRWFIWTIVFLVVAGIGLTSFIMLSDYGAYDVPEIPVRRVTNNR